MDFLEEIGLTKGEIAVYTALLELGPTTTGPLIAKAKVSASKTYQILDKLMEKGLASYIIKSKTKYFQAAPVQRVMDYLDEKEKAILHQKEKAKEFIHKVQARETNPKPMATIYNGFKGMKTAFEDALASSHDGMIIWAPSQSDNAFSRFFYKFNQKRAQQNIEARILLDESYRDTVSRWKKLLHTEIQFTESTPGTPPIILVQGNKVIISLGVEEITLVIESPVIAQTYYREFEEAWNRKTRIYFGKEGAIRALDEAIEAGRKTKKPLLGFGTDVDDYLVHTPEALQAHFKQQLKYNIKWKMLFAKGFKSPNPLAEVRELPEGFTVPVRTLIYGDKVAIVDFSEPITTIIIDKKPIAEAYTKQFEFLWSMAQKVSK